MTIQHFNTDVIEDIDKLFRIHPPEQRFGYRRFTTYGAADARNLGLTPVEEAIPDKLIAFDEIETAIKHAQEQQNFPSYHLQNTWCPKGKRYNQNRLGYCWTWSGTGCLMTTRAMEDKPTVLLAPVSMGFLVNWANKGNYLESYIKGARERGVCEAVDGNINSWENSASYWQPHEATRKLHRLDAVWDTNNSDDKTMLQHSCTILCAGRSGYAALNWWGHAIEYVEWLWTPGTYLNVTAKIHNSHDEDDFITLEGTRCIPDEFYGFISTVPAE